MNLERLSVRLRPRTRWEAVDLGCAMVRTWRRSLFPPWLLLTLPAALLLVWTLGGWGLFIFWWLLPLFEAPLLVALSRAVFGDLPSPREILSFAPGEAKRAWRELLVRRLQPSRAFALPIAQLEHLQGSARRQRRNVLGRGNEVPAGAAAIFFSVEMLLVVAFFGLLQVLTPTWLGVDWEYLMDGFFEGFLSPWHYKIFFTIWALSIVAVHPFHVAAGFGLYLDRRTELEGWDLEIAFRRLARRLRAAATASAGWLLAASLCWLLLAAPVEAQVAESASSEATVASEESESSAEAPVPPATWDGAPESDPRLLARDILSRPEFGGEKAVEVWQLRHDLTKWLDDVEDEEPADTRPSPALLALVRVVSWLSELSLWVIATVVLVGLLVLAIRRWPEAAGRSVHVETEAPETVLGLDLRRESLPTDVAGEARRLWVEGDVAAALSLLYRGTLARLVGDGVPLRESFTESDCLRAARAVLPPMPAGFFAELTRVWQQAAYAQRLPSPDEGERWWGGWRRHFGDTATSAPGERRSGEAS